LLLDGRCRSGQKDCVLTSTTLLAALPIPPGVMQILPILLMIVVFYFLLIRPNQKKQQTWQQMLSSLKPGDRVTTTGGIRGIILNIKDDAIQLRVAPDNIKLEVVKSAIASVTQEDQK
jgi:preprotein translocase subunit YajC